MLSLSMLAKAAASNSSPCGVRVTESVDETIMSDLRAMNLVDK